MIDERDLAGRDFAQRGRAMNRYRRISMHAPADQAGQLAQRRMLAHNTVARDLGVAMVAAGQNPHKASMRTGVARPERSEGRGFLLQKLPAPLQGVPPAPLLQNFTAPV
jgi:hypothetical protein